MKKPIIFVALFWPLAAHAESMFSTGEVLLFYWYIFVILFLLIFLIFSASDWVRRICALLGSIMVSAVVGGFVLGTTIGTNVWIAAAKELALGAAPVLGFVGGFYLVKPKPNAT